MIKCFLNLEKMILKSSLEKNKYPIPNYTPLKIENSAC